MRKPSEKELKCILYSRNMYPPRFKNKSIIQKILFLKASEVESDFNIKRCVVGKKKTFRELWERYGLEWIWGFYDIHGNFVERGEEDVTIVGKDIPREFQNKFFSDEENIKCINYWIKVLYKKELDLSSMLEEYKLEISDTLKKLKEESSRKNTLMGRPNFPRPIENLIFTLDNLLGEYD